jgi:hypothetical protein
MHHVTRCWTAAALMPTSRTHMRLRTTIALRRVAHHALHLLQQATMHSQDGAYALAGGLMSLRTSTPQPFATQQGRLVSQGRLLRCAIEVWGAEALRAHVDGVFPDMLDDASRHHRKDSDRFHDQCMHA